MEKSFESSSGAFSLAKDFENDLSNFNDADELFGLYADSLKYDHNFNENMKQLTRMAALLSNPGVDDIEATMNFAAGEIIGYTAMIKLEGEDIVDDIRDAINDLYALGRLKANNFMLQRGMTTNLLKISEDFRQRFTGFIINDILDKKFRHDSITDSEMDVVFDMIRKITDKDEEESTYDALRGYLFIRAAIYWHKDYKEFRQLEKDDPKHSEIAELREFYDIISDIEIDETLVDGKLDVNSSITSLIDKVNQDLLDMDIEDVLESDEEEYDDKVTAIIRTAVEEMADLEIEHRVSVEDRGMFITVDSDFNLLDIHPIPLGMCVEGDIIDFQLQSAPTEKWLDILYNLDEGQSVKHTDIDYEISRLAMFIDNVVLFNKLDNSRYTPDEDVFVYIPLGYDKSNIYRINKIKD